MEVVASLSQGRTAAAQCGLFTYKSVPVIFETPCISKSCCLINFIITTAILSFVKCLRTERKGNSLSHGSQNCGILGSNPA